MLLIPAALFFMAGCGGDGTQCADGLVLVDGICSCPEGYVLNNGICIKVANNIFDDGDETVDGDGNGDGDETVDGDDTDGDIADGDTTDGDTTDGDDTDGDIADGDTTDGDETTDGDQTADGDEDFVENELDTVPTGASWYDPSTNLTWQNTEINYDFYDYAASYCDELTIDNHGDWRLPTISELRSLIRGCPDAETGGICGVNDTCLDDSCQAGCFNSCWGGSGPADGCYWADGLTGSCRYYWTSSIAEEWAGSVDVWVVQFFYGDLQELYDGFNDGGIRCVREGP